VTRSPSPCRVCARREPAAKRRRDNEAEAEIIASMFRGRDVPNKQLADRR
jgi:hypothetical protein